MPIENDVLKNNNPENGPENDQTNDPKNDLKNPRLAPQSNSESLPDFGSESRRAAVRQTLRWGLSLPFAGLMTLGLGVTMAGLIAVEFVPQDKLGVLKADINPVAHDIKTIIPIELPERFKDIDVPPPPPNTGNTAAMKVIVGPVTAELEDVKIDLTKLKITKIASLNLDTNYQPLVRVPPIMPNSAQRSGHCKVRFDVSSQGQPFNVEAVFCSDKLFARNTLKSVGGWKFRPRMTGGQALTVSGVENIVRFQLVDNRGQIIPE